MSTKPKTQPSVFIIESLSLQDERHDRFEGRILNHILMLARKDVRYAYIRTTKELRAMLKEFDQSRMRYLHISCHGNPTALGFNTGRSPLYRIRSLDSTIPRRPKALPFSLRGRQRSLSRSSHVRLRLQLRNRAQESHYIS